MKNVSANQNIYFKKKPNFSTLGSIIQISPKGPINSFVFDDSITNLLGFHETKQYKEYELSPNPIEIFLFEKIFLDCDIAKGTIYKQKRSGKIHKWTMTVNPSYNYVESFSGGITWYLMQTTDAISSISFKLKNENNRIVSFNGQSISFRLSIIEK